MLIPQKRDPLCLNIKGQGYKLHYLAWMNNCILEFSKVHTIEFGEVFIHE